ncbi:LacI family DNA-binding transcriptional regulator [Planobispora siamensis]|uniref:Alanine racemase n=1 Tax=Planobispora siamensis TaxID=936338 RepID=A0A8J3SFD1_9ACTN|nr:LacI family DNA-binding transcriptional regulator [Planobispora siamensis]GIH93566.1 alanine racemase [Planobispora siamensis]
MTQHRATLTEVARRAGVSPTTASFVMTGRTDMRISVETRDRVLRVAHELNYRPNLMARSLRSKVTQTIALISDTIATEQYAGQIVYGSLAAAAERRHLLFICETEGDPVLEERLINDLLDRQVDGFIYATMYTRRARVPRSLRGQRLVLLNCAAGREIPAVVPDEVGAGRTAAQALIDAGHRDGIHLVGERAPHLIAGSERIQGIEAALGAAGVSLAGSVDCAWWPESAYEAMAAFLAAGHLPKALICMNDRVALGAYQALQEAGLGIPEDVSVVSFDDSDLATWLRPQLTSVALPHQWLGRRAVEILLGEAEHEGVERLPMPLRHRSSVASPRGRSGRDG